VTTHLWITQDYYQAIIKSILDTTHAGLFLTSHKAKSILKWDYNVSFFDVLDILIEEEKKLYE